MYCKKKDQLQKNAKIGLEKRVRKSIPFGFIFFKNTYNNIVIIMGEKSIHKNENEKFAL